MVLQVFLLASGSGAKIHDAHPARSKRATSTSRAILVKNCPSKSVNSIERGKVVVTLEEAIEEREQLRRTIFELIREFEREYKGVLVDEIEIEREYQSYGGHTRLLGVKILLKIE
jgi:hypothetical protein